MTSIFDFSQYTKIVINDLSLNGDLSSNLSRLGIGVTGPTGPAGSGGAGGGGGGGSSYWSISSGTDIYYNPDPSANVGINTSTPIFALDVTGHVRATNDVITGTGFKMYSDARIKENVQGLEKVEALEKIKLLKPVTYNQILQNNESLMEGFIAQEVKDVIPLAVSEHSGFVPNIKDDVTYDSVNKRIVFTHFDTSLLYKDLNGNIHKVLHLLNGGTLYKVKIKSVISDNTIEIDEHDFNLTSLSGNIHVIGQEVSDFHYLKTDNILTYTVSALQQLENIVEIEKEKVKQLTQENEELKIKITTILQRLTTLENAN